MAMGLYLPEHKQPEGDNRYPIEGKAIESGEAKDACCAPREGGHRGPAVLHHCLVVRDRRLTEGFHLRGSFDGKGGFQNLPLPSDQLLFLPYLSTFRL